MNQYEEELQKNIEGSGQPVGDELDIKAYQEVFLRLNRKPDIQLPVNFADNIVAQVIEKRRRDASRDFIWFGLGIFSLVIAFIVAIAMSSFRMNLGFLKEMSGYAGLLVFGIAFILTLNHLDRKLIHEKISQRNTLLRP